MHDIEKKINAKNRMYEMGIPQKFSALNGTVDFNIHTNPWFDFQN